MAAKDFKSFTEFVKISGTKRRRFKRCLITFNDDMLKYFAFISPESCRTYLRHSCRYSEDALEFGFVESHISYFFHACKVNAFNQCVAESLPPYCCHCPVEVYGF
ncbi:hypothetical protein Barb7_02707 [Bacteroidales bacterium Barb7]|nr:hypothetical protein Barb7_02707 [Bacteroidales bacterium Barb7]